MNVKRLFWYFMLAISGTLLGITGGQLLSQNTGETTFYLFISGLIFAVITAWGMKKYLGVGFFSNKK